MPRTVDQTSTLSDSSQGLVLLWRRRGKDGSQPWWCPVSYMHEGMKEGLRYRITAHCFVRHVSIMIGLDITFWGLFWVSCCKVVANDIGEATGCRRRAECRGKRSHRQNNAKIKALI